MTMRVFLAGLLGAIAMFVWSFVSHDVLPLGEAGIAGMPGEGAVVTAIQGSIGDKTGLYMFPWADLGPNASGEDKKAAMAQAEEKMKTSPSGMLLYHATRNFNFPKRLMFEFGTELVEALLAVWLLSKTRIARFGGRVGFVFVVGLLAAITTDVPNWNWYGFPTKYIGGQMTIHLVQFLIVGVVAALVLGKRDPAAA